MVKRKLCFLIILLLCTLILIWFSGLLPKQVAIVVANNYMAEQENCNLYEFKNIEYSSAHDSYFVCYTLKEDIQKGRWLEIPYKYFPFYGVFKDSNHFTD